MLKVAVDAMGGDFPVSAPVAGAIEAVRQHQIPVIIVGDERQITVALSQHKNYDSSLVSIKHCTQKVEMDDSPSVALRTKKESSIRIAMNLHRDQEVCAVVSAGHSGATMTIAKIVLKEIKHIDRPAIITPFPSKKGHFVLLDVGANVECKPQYLLQFALMGESYSRLVFGVEEPQVALLSNGEEEVKGNSLTKETYALLKQSQLHFMGNIEGKDMFDGQADVIVCDGFVGNITLKVAEGTFEFIRYLLKKEIEKSWIAKLGYLCMKQCFKNLLERADYTHVGGAPLLGVNGNVVICHGSSKPYTIAHAIRHAFHCAKIQLNEEISKELDRHSELLQ